MATYLTEYIGTLNGDRYAADDIEADSWEEAEAIVKEIGGIRVIGEFVERIPLLEESEDNA